MKCKHKNTWIIGAGNYEKGRVNMLCPHCKIPIPEYNRVQVDLQKIRQAIADYMISEGCSCCRDIDAHKINKERIAKMLHIPQYLDKSGYNFFKFRSTLKKQKDGE